LPYDVRRGGSVEVHTVLTDGPFVAEVPPGRYLVRAERGKEFLPVEREVEVGPGGVDVALPLRRWTDMAARGWFSGDTHVHRPVEDLELLVLAEDLNVALPLTSWVTDSGEVPSRDNKNPDPVPPAGLIEADATHVIWPVNTEYEIFTVDGRQHTLGAVFVLNHRTPLDLPAPPVRPVAEAARAQGALLDLDKHNWPWSLMLVPVMGVDLFELANNHLWQAPFIFGNWYPEHLPEHLGVVTEGGRYSELGWVHSGFETYYALLNCGFAMKPSAGTATGVHPVPLGFGRVYVKVDGGFRYDRWVDGLAAGRSFVTTGPMLVATFDGHGPWARLERAGPGAVEVTAEVESLSPPGPVEVVANGVVVARAVPPSERLAGGGFRARSEQVVPVAEGGWLVVRCWEERADGRPRFAHTAPVWVEVEGRPPPPPRARDVGYFVGRVESEIARHRGVLGDEALAEFEEALAAYRSLLPGPSEPARE
jgi:hypothetical protein